METADFRLSSVICLVVLVLVILALLGANAPMYFVGMAGMLFLAILALLIASFVVDI